MEYDLLSNKDLTAYFEDAYKNKESLKTPLIYEKGTINQEDYNNMMANKGEYCYINTVGGPTNTRWYLYHCHDNKIIFVNRVINYFYCTSTYLWFYCWDIDLLTITTSCYGIGQKKKSTNELKYDLLSGFDDVELSNMHDDYFIKTDIMDVQPVKKILKKEILTNIYHNIYYTKNKLSLIHPDKIVENNYYYHEPLSTSSSNLLKSAFDVQKIKCI